MTTITTSAAAVAPDAVRQPRVALALSGGGARGLAQIGVLEVFECEGIAVDFIAGSSMGGLIGALHASGLSARELLRIAARFHFPRWFVPGALLTWERIFPGVAEVLPGTFELLRKPLALATTDIEAGCQVVLHSGALLPAVRATCAIPGVLPPECSAGHWLVDGALVNLLPVDVAWMADPDLVIAVRVGGPRAHRMPQLQWKTTRWLAGLGRFLPNPMTAKHSTDMLVRAAEILLERQTALSVAMTDPDLLIEPELVDFGLRDFDRLEPAVAAGRRAAEAALPLLRDLLSNPAIPRRPSADARNRYVDPVCGMVIRPARARATATHAGKAYYFCSCNCCDQFLRAPTHYPGVTELTFGPPPP